MLARKLNLWALTATGICSMVGASIYVVPFMIHRHVPGVGPYVMPAFLFAAIPALFAALAYAMLASAMPRAGGSYIFASRGLHPYLGFVASFSQWFGLSIAIGVISYVIVPFAADVANAAGHLALAETIRQPGARFILALVILWFFVGINMLGVRAYTFTLIPLMILMFLLGGLVIWAGWSNHPDEFITAYRQAGHAIPAAQATFSWTVFFSAAAVLFASFIGFDAIAQAGGEARNASRTLPKAIGLTMLVVSCFYFLFASAVYHVVPWNIVAQEASKQDINAASLLSYVLSPTWTIIILGGATIALLNDLPGMILSNSRLVFAWSADKVFPAWIAHVHLKSHLPRRAILLSGLMATLGVLGCHLAGSFFLGIDILVTSMLVNFLIMCITVFSIHRVNPTLGAAIRVLHRPLWIYLVSVGGIFFLSVFLIIHTYKDLSTTYPAWYFHSSWLWLLTMTMASAIYYFHTITAKRAGINLAHKFAHLPNE